MVVDAYDGTVRFYVADAQDPLVRAYAAAFPGLLEPIEAMPADLRAHVRYPAGFFAVQARMYATYHMQDPRVFYNKEDLWSVPRMAEGGRDREIDPYYTIMRIPGESREEFVLLMPFTPLRRDNMIAWLAARSDGPAYGRLVAFLFPKQRLVFGPRQISARIDQDAVISQQLTLWSQRGSTVIRGSLLAIPVEESLAVRSAALPGRGEGLDPGAQAGDRRPRKPDRDGRDARRRPPVDLRRPAAAARRDAPAAAAPSQASARASRAWWAAPGRRGAAARTHSGGATGAPTAKPSAGSRSALRALRERAPPR